jgi:autotransporter-associated beta strand protein
MLIQRIAWVGLSAALWAAVPAVAVAATANWNADSDGNWTDAGNWTAGGPPSAAGEIAHLNFDLTTGRIITLDANQTIGILNLSDPTPTGSNYFSYTISGLNTLALSNTGGAQINKTQNYSIIDTTGASPNNGLNSNTARDVIDVPIQLQSNLSIRNNALNGALEFSKAIGNDGTNRNVTVRGPNLGGSTPSGQGGRALVVFSAANSYGGTTTIDNGGRLQISHGQALGNGNIASIAGGGSTNGTASLELAGGITVNNNVTAITGTDSNLNTVGRIENVSGHNTFAGNIQGIGTGGASYPIHSVGTTPGDFFTFAGDIINNRTTSENVRILRFGGAGNGEVTGKIRETGNSFWNLAKDHAGTWILSGDNTYRGATTVNGGALLVNGTHADGGAYTVATGGTLGGIGTINGAAITIQAGGTISPGGSVVGVNDIDNFTIASATIAGTLKIEYNSDTSIFDRLDVAATLDISAATLNLQNLGTAALSGGPYVLATFDSLVNAPQFLSVTGTIPSGYELDYLEHQIVLVQTSIAGDFDGDGDVDGADFIVWQTNYPTTSGATAGDADNDDDVDGADFAAWQNAFPTSPGPGVSQVPEPVGIVLMAIAITVTPPLFRSRRRPGR